MNDTTTQFRDAIRSTSMEPPEDIKSGTFHRFPGIGKGKGNTAGWCVLFPSGYSGAFGDWSSGLRKNWRAKSDKPLTEAEKAEYKRHIEEAKKRATAEKKRQQINTARKAKSIWEKAQPANSKHPYLIRKGIRPCAAREYKGLLVMPVMFEGKIVSLQFIARDGRKRFLRGGLVTGGHCAVDKAQDTKTICIAEGFATAATVHEATGFLTIIAFCARSLETVAKYVRQKIPESSIVICADDDIDTEGNPGITEANKAARAVGAKVAIPKFGDQRPDGASDFNDLAKLKNGREAVKQAINAASVPISNSDTEESDWLKLVSLDAPDLPCLERECLPAWAGEYARAVAAATETPLELAVGMILATCGTACARRMKVHVKQGYSEPCNLWIVVALPPGERKSSVQSAATKPLIEWENDQAANMEEDIIRATSEHKSMEARIKELRSRAAKEKKLDKAKDLMKQVADYEVELPEIPSVPRLWTSDSTPERLAILMAENNECMGWMSSEGGVFDLLEGRYSRGIPNLDLVLQAHSADPSTTDRSSRPTVRLQYPRLSVGLSPQPDVLKGLASKPGFRGRGLLGRFLYFLPRSPLGNRTHDGPPVPDKVKEAYMEGIRTMLNWEADFDENKNMRPHVVQMSDESRDLYREFALNIEIKMRAGGELEHFTDWGGKVPGVAVRLAGVLHGIKHAKGKPWEVEIAAETMEAALEIIAVSTKHSLVALDMMGADQTVAAARQVWDWVKRNRLSGFTEREAFNAHRSTFPRMKYLKSALGVLVERGYVKIITPSKDGAGRPRSPVVIVRPELVESWK
ncbi:MAG: DUF3987 domain-containing protein [Gammaproteobacteria bacterium]|nr:DUF3987 domain-containing protein [Gammaproteobacteria bacterium]